MAKFVLIYRDGETPPAPSPDVMETWMAWFGQLGDAVVELGAPLGASATVASDGTSSEGTGTDPVTGYTVVQAATMDDAVALANGCPGLATGGSVTLHQVHEMG